MFKLPGRWRKPPLDFAVISRSLDDALPRLSDLLAANAAAASADVHTLAAPSFTLYSTKPLTDQARPQLFDGYVFYRRLIHGRHSPPNAQERAAIGKEWRALTGNYCLGDFDCVADQFTLRADVLGQYQLFHFALAPESFAVATNPYVLERILKHVGSERQRSPAAVCLNVTYLSVFEGVSSFRHIEPLRPRHILSFDNANGLAVSPGVTRDSVFSSAESYRDALADAAQAIAANCEMIADLAETGVHTVCDLSGGVDSRIVLAGLIRTRRTESVAFFNVNNAREGTSADRVVADRLRRKYGLAAGRGVTEGASATMTRNSHLRFPLSAELAYGVGHYYGMLPYALEDFGDLYLDRYCRVGGYCGEHLRAPGPNLGQLVRSGANGSNLATAFLSHVTAPGKTNAADVLTGEGVQVVYNAFRTYFDELCGSVPDTKLVNTCTYVENRSRCHFGIRSMNANRSRISVSPLVAPQLLRLHAHLSYSELNNNKAAYDLLVTLGGKELAWFPYANDRWGRHALGDDYAEYIRQHSIASDEPAAQDNPQNRPLSLPVEARRTPSLPAEWRTEGAANGVPESLSEVAGSLIDAIPAHDEVWSLLDRDHVISVCSEKDHVSRIRHVNLMGLAATLTFYAEMSATSRLAGRVDVPRLARQELRKQAG